jgi:16S rRNA (adenine1518-N6/adenine1519-N6)-dimethyltransferase
MNAVGLMRRHGFTPIKKYGQNFLVDGNIITKITNAISPNPADSIIEIGPGLGALTIALAERAGSVTAIEADKKIIPLLAEEVALAGAKNIEIVCADFLEYELPETFDYKLIGNLPYYITTPILIQAAEAKKLPNMAVFMMQREVAGRVTAPPGSKTYGAVSVAVQYRFDADYLFDVSREVFTPKPGVDSAVIRLTPRGDCAVRAKDERTFFALVKAGFGQRRKMLRNSLRTSGFSGEAIERAFDAAGIAPTARAEELSVKDFVTLADSIAANAENIIQECEDEN